MLRGEFRSVRTLALGSSHGDYAFDPAYLPGGFNLCSRSQDLRHSHAIHRRVARGMPHLRDVIVFFSIFSPGHVLERSPSERVHCIALHDVLDLDLAYADADLARHAGTWTAALAPTNVAVEGRGGFLPGFHKSWFPDSYGVERRAHEHLKRGAASDALPYLVAILLEAQHHGHRVSVVIPPARSDYRVVCKAYAPDPFAALHAIVREVARDLPVRIVDLFDDPEFADTDFGDFDHLRPEGPGAERLTRRVADALA